MFSSYIQEIKRTDDTNSYFDVIFSNGIEEYTREYKVLTERKDFEINNLELTQIPNMIDILNSIEIKEDSIFNENGELNF